MPLSLFHPHNPHRPNRAAMEILQEAYAAITPRSPANPWTESQATHLGRLYSKAWTVLPIPSRMNENYCLPNASTIIRLYGSYQRFYAAIEGKVTP